MARENNAYLTALYVAQCARKHPGAEGNAAAIVDTDQEPGRVHLVLPWPPTGNHAVKHTRNGSHYLTDEYKAYRATVKSIIAQVRAQPISSPYKVSVVWFPPDNRRRDSDNTAKTLFDSLIAAGIISDDSMRDKREYSETVVLPTKTCDGSVSIAIWQ